MIFQPRSRTSGMWVWPQPMTRASVRETRSTVDRGVEDLVEARRLRAGRGVADQDERRRRAAGDARPAGGEASRAARRRAASWAHSAAAGWHRARLVQPRERGRVVEVGDGDVGVALDDDRAVGLQLADGVHGLGRLGAVEDQVAGDERWRRASGAMALRTASSARALPWTSPRARRSGPSAQHPGVRDDEAEASPRRRPRRRPRPLPDPARSAGRACPW